MLIMIIRGISWYVIMLGIFREMKPVGCMYVYMYMHARGHVCVCVCMEIDLLYGIDSQDCGGWQVSRICISKTGDPGEPGM